MPRRLALGSLGSARPLASLVVISSLLLPVVSPVVAFAADTSAMGQDEVTLKDGGTVRGTVVSSRPGVGVKIIELGSTEARMIPWAEVGDVERGKFASKKKAAVQPGSGGPGYAAEPVPPPPPPGPPPGNQVRLHIDSPVPAMVYSHQTAYGAVNGYGFVVDAATPVCSAPCDKVFDAGSGQTFTAGGEFNSSPAFSLMGHKGDVELSLQPGSRGLRIGGLALIWVGGLAVLTGASFMLTGAIIPSTNTTTDAYGNPTTTDSGTGWLLPAGAAIGGGGLAMIAGGIVMLIESKTKIDLHPMGSTVSGQAASAKPRYWMGEF